MEPNQFVSQGNGLGGGTFKGGVDEMLFAREQALRGTNQGHTDHLAGDKLFDSKRGNILNSEN
jgi:hypothetical protein